MSADGFTMLTGGMNSGLDPIALRSTQYAKGINVSVRGGLVHTRPGFVQETDFKVDGNLMCGRTFQGARRWRTTGGDMIVACYTGSIVVFDVDAGLVYGIGPQMIPTNQVFMAQVDKYMVVQDGERAIVLRWSDTAPKVSVAFSTVLDNMPGTGDEPPTADWPVGTVMHYCHGRLHLVPRVVPGTSESGAGYFVSGDILLPGEPESVLMWSENQYLNTGGAFGLPDELGDIKGMGSLRNSATGSGVGSLIVLAQGGVAAFNVALPREGVYDINPGDEGAKLIQPGWKEQSIGQVLFYGAGTESPWSVVNVNNDLVYRGTDGIRFLQYSNAQAKAGSTSWSLSNTPQSSEVDVFLAQDDAAHLPYVSLDFNLSRILTTSVGRGNTTFRGLISMDTSVAYAISSKLPPAYDGLWTGKEICMVLSATRDGRPVTFFLTPEPAMYRIDDGLYVDGTASKIESQLTTRAMFSAQVITMKELKWVDLWLSGLRHDTTIAVYYRPDKYPLWTRLGEAKTFLVTEGSLPQERRRIRFSASTTNRSRPGGGMLTKGNTFQFLFVWQGWAQIDRVMCEATDLQESPPLCDNETTTRAISASDGIVENDFSYVMGA